jgi:hypothetical protein
VISQLVIVAASGDPPYEPSTNDRCDLPLNGA